MQSYFDLQSIYIITNVWFLNEMRLIVLVLCRELFISEIEQNVSTPSHKRRRGWGAMYRKD
jgi:hypothetical protein